MPMQERFTDMKAEIRGLLVQQGVKAMRMVPVKRSYAFENTNVASGEQWVLKVRDALSVERMLSA